MSYSGAQLLQGFRPNEVLRVSDLLEIVGPPPSHEELQRRNLLVEWRPSLLTIFVSHKWLSSWHPDPDGLQLKILQKALQNTIDGTVKVESDVVSQLRQQYRRLGEKDREQLANAYVWLDWFSIPQIPNSKAELGIQSIPFYVGACQLFIALVPPLRHFSSQQDCDLASWLSRGCCTELPRLASSARPLQSHVEFTEFLNSCQVHSQCHLCQQHAVSRLFVVLSLSCHMLECSRV